MVTSPASKNFQFRFIDLFAGIGGFRLSFQRLGGTCLFSSEIDRFSQATYEANFGDVPAGDICQVSAESIPAHDILLAGFPCQAFSIAGRRRGFEDARGTLFFHVARILASKQPSVFLLENVKGLLNHQRGETLKSILHILRHELGYYVPDPQLLNARHFGVPQNRERVFIVGFHPRLNMTHFEYPIPPNPPVQFADVKEREPVSVKYYLSTQYLKTLRRHRERHKRKGNGFGFSIIQDEQVANAIVVGGMGRERNLVYDHRLTNFTPITRIKGVVNREGIRKMTPREWARLQGFPDEFKIIVSDAQAYKQFGNSVAVPVVQAMGNAILAQAGAHLQIKP